MVEVARAEGIPKYILSVQYGERSVDYPIDYNGKTGTLALEEIG